MFTDILRQLRPMLVIFVALTFSTGVIYPLIVSGIAWTIFPGAAQGSLIEKDGNTIGSGLVGQPFASDKYFWGRPSATSPQPYNAAASSGSNLGPTNPALIDAVKQRVADLKARHPEQKVYVPIDLVTASASGLDPHISPAAAYYQVDRIAAARNLTAQQVRDLVTRHIEPRTLGFLGEPRVNVLVLNLAVDDLH
jgi:K+-transporting ATPase ATPase C chain